LKIEEIEAFFNTIAQFTNARSIHSAFYQWRMIDDNQKRFTPHLGIETKLFHSAFVNPCMMWNQSRSQRCAPTAGIVLNGQLLYEMAPLI
jgi:hypothetical protein